MSESTDKLKINPNSASDEQLQQLAGVGPGLAERIRQGRPYQQAEDLLAVAGVGQGSLNRWSEQLTFAAEPESERPKDQAKTEKTAAKPTENKVETKVKGAQTSRQPTSNLLWMLLAVFISVFLSVSLTLGILLSINGTLNTGRHAQVQSLHDQLAQAEADLADLNTQLEGVEQRVGALQGLSGRMGDVEDQLGELHGEVNQALTNVDSISQRFDAVEELTQSLGSRVDRFDQFLVGLRQLLNEPDEAASPGVQQEGTPSQ